MWAVFSFVMHYWMWVAAAGIATVVLCLLAFYLRNWKMALAGVVIFVAGLVYMGTYAAGYNAKVAEDVAEQTKILNERLATLEKLAEADKARSDQDAATIANLQKRAAKTPENKGACLPKGAAKRIRNIR